MKETLSSPNELARHVPHGPFSDLISEEAHQAWLVSVLFLNCLGSAREAYEGISSSWRKGNFLNAAILTRPLIELWATAFFAKKNVSKNLDAIQAKQTLDLLLSGSSSPITLPWGGVSTSPPVGIRKLIKCLNKHATHAGADYGFLCDASHPCFFQHKYLRMAGASEDNWSNQIFASHAHEVLEQLVRILENSIDGLVEEGISILTTSKPLLITIK